MYFIWGCQKKIQGSQLNLNTTLIINNVLEKVCLKYFLGYNYTKNFCCLADNQIPWTFEIPWTFHDFSFYMYHLPEEIYILFQYMY